jgi:hypothetical protein
MCVISSFSLHHGKYLTVSFCLISKAPKMSLQAQAKPGGLLCFGKCENPAAIEFPSALHCFLLQHNLYFIRLYNYCVQKYTIIAKILRLLKIASLLVDLTSFACVYLP